MQPVPLQPDNNDDNDDNDDDDDDDDDNDDNDDDDNDDDNDDDDDSDDNDDDDDSDVGPNTAEWNSIQPPAPFVGVVVPCGADNLGAGGAPTVSGRRPGAAVLGARIALLLARCSSSRGRKSSWTSYPEQRQRRKSPAAPLGSADCEAPVPRCNWSKGTCERPDDDNGCASHGIPPAYRCVGRR